MPGEGIPLDHQSIRLLEKQRQFNAAMERYDSVRGYKVFGTAVAVVNGSLQVWLLWRVQALAIGAAGQAAALLIAWVLADFVNGLVHLYMDGNDRYDSLVGPLIANFHLHHKIPRYKPNPLAVVYFTESGSKVWLAPCLAGVALLARVDGISPLFLYVLVYTGILSSVAEVSHYLCHTSSSPLAGFLARCGILLSKRRHAAHHLHDNVSYAFLNGITDPILDRIAVKFSKGYKNHTDLHYAAYAVEGETR